MILAVSAAARFELPAYRESLQSVSPFVLSPFVPISSSCLLLLLSPFAVPFQRRLGICLFFVACVRFCCLYAYASFFVSLPQAVSVSPPSFPCLPDSNSLCTFFCSKGDVAVLCCWSVCCCCCCCCREELLQRVPKACSSWEGLGKLLHLQYKYR